MEKKDIANRSADYAAGKVNLQKLEYVYLPAAQGGDPLFQPTLQDAQYIDEPDSKPPFHLNALVFVAMLGGALAVTVIAYVNSVRLNLSRRKQITIAAAGLFGYLAALFLQVYLYPYWRDHPIEFVHWLGARASNITAILLVWFFYTIQRVPYKLYASRNENFSSAWIPGALLIVFGYISHRFVVSGAVYVLIRLGFLK